MKKEKTKNEGGEYCNDKINYVFLRCELNEAQPKKNSCSQE